MKRWMLLLVAAGIGGGSRPAAAACPSFDPDGLLPGMTLAEARRVVEGEEDGPEVAAVGDGFETTAYFRNPPARIALIFPGRVTARSKVGLAAVRSCVPIATFDGATFAERLRARFGEPTSGSSVLDGGMIGGEVAWSDPACSIDVRAWRNGSWYDPASEAWCVEQRAVRGLAPAPAASGEAPGTPAPEPAVERPAALAAAVEPIPEPPPPALGAVPAATAPVLVASVPPRYPEMLRQRRLRAHVVARATIEADGSVGGVEIVSCDRPGFGLEERVSAAVRQWRYKPATQRGTPVTSEIQIPFEFD